MTRDMAYLQIRSSIQSNLVQPKRSRTPCKTVVHQFAKHKIVCAHLDDSLYLAILGIGSCMTALPEAIQPSAALFAVSRQSTMSVD